MGVVSNNWFARVFTFSSWHAQTLMLTDVQTPFLGTPLVLLNQYTYIYLSLSLYIYIYTYISLPLSLSIYIYTYMCILLYMYMYMYVYVYIYIYIHTHTYTHTHTYVDLGPRARPDPPGRPPAAPSAPRQGGNTTSIWFNTELFE